MLNTKNHVVGDMYGDIITIGLIASAEISPREIFKKVLSSKKLVSSIILIHNHPSGVTFPSSADIECTKKIVEAGNIIGIKVLDHIIVGKDYYSFKEDGIIF